MPPDMVEIEPTPERWPCLQPVFQVASDPVQVVLREGGDLSISDPQRLDQGGPLDQPDPFPVTETGFELSQMGLDRMIRQSPES